VICALACNKLHLTLRIARASNQSPDGFALKITAQCILD
jgi:hypothetical protein